jgi:hypothetical protein
MKTPDERLSLRQCKLLDFSKNKDVESCQEEILCLLRQQTKAWPPKLANPTS